MQYKKIVCLMNILLFFIVSLSFSGCLESDIDGDRLTDSIEEEGMDIRVYNINGTIQEITVTSDPNKVDTDGDGLTDYEEAIASTNPSVKDTDGDGLTDYEEVGAQSSPFHFDTWMIEIKGVEQRVYAQYPNFASLPTTYDSDKDGLMDSEEYQHLTDPQNADTDGDGSDDYLDPDPNWNLQVNISLDSFTLKKNKDAEEGADLYIVIQVGDISVTTEVYPVSLNQEIELNKAFTIDFSDSTAYEKNNLQIQLVALDEDPGSLLGDSLIQIDQDSAEYRLNYDITELDPMSFSTNGNDGDLAFTIYLFRS